MIKNVSWKATCEVQNDSVEVPVVHSVFKNERNAKNPIKELLMHNKGSLQKVFKNVTNFTWEVYWVKMLHF